MKRAWLVFAQVILSLGLAACNGAVPTIAPTEAPDKTLAEVAVTAEATTAPTPALTPTEAPTLAPTEAAAASGPRTGDVAPDFTLPDSNGNMVRLTNELQDNRMVVLVFFHSYD